jgi:hypothetical protein
MSSAIIWIPRDLEVEQVYAESRSDLGYRSFGNTYLTKKSFVSMRGIFTNASVCLLQNQGNLRVETQGGAVDFGKAAGSLVGCLSRLAVL